MSGRHNAAEGRREAAVTHLAWLGVKIAGNGILGYFPEKKNKIQKSFTKENLRISFKRFLRYEGYYVQKIFEVQRINLQKRKGCFGERQPFCLIFL